MSSSIVFQQVSKSFVSWYDRPQSIKTLLAQAITLNLELGHKDKKEILKNINLEIKAGDFVGIMGRNGAGKSTLLKLISGIYKPTAGSITHNGRLVPLLELGAGFASELDGVENIYLNGSILGYGREALNAKVQDIIAFSELGNEIYKPVRNYSSGMLVRLGFSIAAHLDADILLFDEILAVGDVGFQKKCLNKIHELHSQKKTIVLVTHSTEQVEMFCNRSIIFDKSGIIFDGPPMEGSKVYNGLF